MATLQTPATTTTPSFPSVSTPATTALMSTTLPSDNNRATPKSQDPQESRSQADQIEEDEGDITSYAPLTMLARAMLAGSTAGFMEHLVMYPVDTVKTRMQVAPCVTNTQYTSLANAFSTIIRKEGLSALYRGAPMVVSWAIPTHALYFGAYEATRVVLRADRREHNPGKTALAGVAATMAHDFLVTPVDVIKQRLQMENSPFRSSLDVFRRSPWGQLFRSFPTTVCLNIPFVSTNFVVYESIKLITDDTWIANESSMGHHLVCGGIAGAAGGFVSTPLDVVKTRIQTDCECGQRPIRHLIGSIYQREGLKGLFSGVGARTCYFIPSAAITWSVYEAAKSLLGWKEEFPDDLMV